MKQNILLTHKVSAESALSLPYYDSGIKAGFPSPAADYEHTTLDLNEKLIKNPSTTFIARVSGDSLLDDNIEDGDLVIVDRSLLPPKDGDLAVCVIDNEFTLKYVSKRTDGIYLVPGNSSYPTIKVDEESEFYVWGIVTYSFKDLRNKSRHK